MESSKPLRPPLQLKLMLWFVGVAGSALVLQFLVFSEELSALAVEIPGVEAHIERFAEACSRTVRVTAPI